MFLFCSKEMKKNVTRRAARQVQSIITVATSQPQQKPGRNRQRLVESFKSVLCHFVDAINQAAELLQRKLQAA